MNPKANQNQNQTILKFQNYAKRKEKEGSQDGHSQA
jgi:hypothetical protein